MAIDSPPRSAEGTKPGSLYVVATPIGNLEDITQRALGILRECDLIACEDTRRTVKLLNHFDIRKRMVSYHEHNERARSIELIAEIKNGASVALLSDAGTPVLSDPGRELVSLCIGEGIPIVPIPGASAAIAALSVSGIAGDEFYFVGFLPARTGERRRSLQRLAALDCALILYEAPHRIAAMLGDAYAVLGNREAVLAREVTKIHEEFLRGTLSELGEMFTKGSPRGEMTVVIAPPSAEQRASVRSSAPGEFASRVRQLEAENAGDKKSALKEAAREFGITRRVAYKRWLVEATGEE